MANVMGVKALYEAMESGVFKLEEPLLPVCFFFSSFEEKKLRHMLCTHLRGVHVDGQKRGPEQSHCALVLRSGRSTVGFFLIFC